MRVTSCCHNAIKAASLTTWLTTPGHNNCPHCRKGPFSDELGDRRAAPAAPVYMPLFGGYHPAPVPAAGGPPAPLNLFLNNMGRLSIIGGIILLYANTVASQAATTFTKAYAITWGVGLILLGTGTALEAVSRLDPHQTFIRKISSIASSLLLGASLNGVGTLIITTTTYTMYIILRSYRFGSL